MASGKPTLISIVSPVYGSPGLIPELCRRLHKSLQELTEAYEIVLVFDCSPDDGWERICDSAVIDARVKGLRLSRNFGQHAAITAGLTRACGEWVVVMDCDLQDRPEELPKLFAKAQEGFKVVLATRQQRRNSLFDRVTSRFFYAVFNRLAGANMDHAVANYGIYRRDVTQAFLEMKDSHRFFPLFVQWMGFPTARVPVTHDSRSQGRSAYNLSKRAKLAVNTIIAFSNQPLQMMIAAGLSISAISAGLVVYYVAQYLFGNITEPGFASLILSIWLVGGLLMMCMGILGVYVGRIFDQTKGRPWFIVDETTSNSSQQHESVPRRY